VPRIGFDGRALASPAAGMRRYTRELFGALARFHPSLAIVAVGTPSSAIVPSGIEAVAPASSLPTNLGWMFTGLPATVRRAKVHMFHAPAYTTPFGIRPVVVTIHDVSYARHPEWYPYKRDPVRRSFYRHSAVTADRIITDSSFSKFEIVAAYGVRPESIDVVPLAASSAFAPGPSLPLPAGCPARYILHVGDLHARRNLEMVARALTLVRARNRSLRDVALVAAGVDRGAADGLARLTASAGGDVPLVWMAGAIQEHTLLALYRAASMLVYPSRYEGFGLPLLEAMGCGVPVVAANASSIPEVAGDAAVLLDPDDEAGWADAIERMFEDRVHASATRAAGVVRASEYTWRRTADETAAVYRKLLLS
jgi:glycosyltransferase involved in cell wall biosynthesis